MAEIIRELPAKRKSGGGRMTREEAANLLDHYCYGNTNILRECDDGLAEKIQTAMDEAIAALREPSHNWNVKECADLIAAMSEGETLTIRKKNGFLKAVRGETIDAWEPLTVWKNY